MISPHLQTSGRVQFLNSTKRKKMVRMFWKKCLSMKEGLFCTQINWYQFSVTQLQHSLDQISHSYPVCSNLTFEKARLIFYAAPFSRPLRIDAAYIGIWKQPHCQLCYNRTLVVLGLLRDQLLSIKNCTISI